MAPLLLLLLGLHAQDPVQVRTRLVDEEIQAGETTVLRIDVETDGERARIGQFRSLPPGIGVESTRDFDQRQFSIPGGSRRFISREFVLRARAAGRYRIPSLDVVVAGNTYSTRSVVLDVTAAPVAPGHETGQGSTDGVVLRAWLDADTVYVGEQVTLNAEAMFSPDVRFRLRRAPEYEPPTPSGFWIQELTERQRTSTRRLNGDVYEVQRFRRAFFPMSDGTFEVPPARLEYEIRRGMLSAPETREKVTDPIPLVVLPVPEASPPGFTGAVGSYTVRGWLEPRRVPAGEAAVLTIEVEGTGNTKTLPPPRLPELDGIDAFPPSEEAFIEAPAGEVRGSKRFSWVLIPRHAGTLEVPEVAYAYFDPGRERFETAAVPAMTLEVTPGTVASEATPAPAIRYLDTRPREPDRLGWVRSPLFAAAQAVPLLLLALVVGWTRTRERGDRPVSSRALRRRRATGLQELEARIGEDGPTLFADADAFTRQWLADRLGLSIREAGRTTSLVAAGVAEDTADAVGKLLERLAAARYAPVSPGPEARRDMLKALDRLLQKVDRDAPTMRRATTPSGQAAMHILLLAAMGAAGIATAAPTSAQQPTTVFDDGVRAFDRERFTAAAEAFGTYVRLRPRDAAGWYNLGTAYHHGGHPGYAIHAWLKAARLDPRHEDVRHNLRIVDVPPELVDRVSPPIPLRPAETLLLAGLAWWSAAIAAAGWILRRRPAAAAVAIAGLVLSIALAAAGWASTRDPDLRIVLHASTLRTGPTLRADPVIQLEPGTGLTPVDVRDDWIRARTIRDDEGWVERTVTGEI